jgi:GNAT superfamily N-acetyltransferase
MITYRMMDATCPLPTCLHSGALPVALCPNNPAYVETISGIPSGTVSRTLKAISARYGSCGVLAVDDELIVGKIRAYPQTLIDIIPYPCVQQEGTIEPVIALSLDTLPVKESNPILHLYCIQVAQGYYGRGIAGGMLDALIAWAHASGWCELRARAVRSIPPLLAWCGGLSRSALERRGFSVIDSTLSPDLREGVVSQRAGHHGEAVRQQWEAFDHLSDDEAAQVFDMTLILGRSAQ